MNHLMKSGDVYLLHRFAQYKGIIGIIYISIYTGNIACVVGLYIVMACYGWDVHLPMAGPAGSHETW